MRLSVIVTTYRRHRHLIRAMVSTFLQNIDQEDADFEVIVANDDPDERAVVEQIVQVAAQETGYPGDVRVISRRQEEVAGVAASRNRAMEAARGDFLLFLDDDDFLMPGALASFASLIATREGDFFYANHVHVIEDADLNEITRIRKIQQDISYDELLVMNRIPIGSFVIARQAVRHFFDESYSSLEDWVFLLDNLRGATMVRGDFDAVTIGHSIAQGYTHRNRDGGAARFVENVCRLYVRHPSSKVVEARRQVLAGVELPSVERLFLPHGTKAMAAEVPRVLSTRQGRFLIVNQEETIQRSLITHGSFEPLAALLAVVAARRGHGLVVDVGANIGTFTIPVGLTVGGDRIVAIEPQRQVFALLEANLVLNGIRNVMTRRIVVAEPGERGTTTRVPVFDVRSERYVGSVSLDSEVIAVRGTLPGVAEPAQRARQYEDVAVMGLDQLLNAQKVDFIKIDVEGMELDVVRSGLQTIRNNLPLIFYEAWPIEGLRHRSQAVDDVLRGLGYLSCPG